MLSTTLMSAAIVGSIAAGPEPGYDYDSQLIDLNNHPNLPLLEAAPYPSRRVDDPRRPELGRVFHGRTPAESIRTSVYDLADAERYGAAIDELGRQIFVQTRRPLPDIVVSPWQRIDEDTFQELRRRRPWVRNEDGAGIIEDLQVAQNRWLRQHGYIKTVRTHVNPATLRAVAGAPTTTDEPTPSGIIRLRPIEPEMEERRASLPDFSGATLVSTFSSPSARVVASAEGR